MSLLIKIKFLVLSRHIVGHILIACAYNHYSSVTSNRWGGRTFDNEIIRCVNAYSPNIEKNRFRYFFLKVDIIWSYYRYKSTPAEYFLFDFQNITLDRRSQFLTNKHKDDVMRDKVGMGENWYLLEDKSKFYTKFQQFFDRDVLIYTDSTQIADLEKFCKKHATFIVKPLFGQCGRGILKIHMADFSNNAYNLSISLSKEGDCILEELIIQDPEFAALNDSSVNTVRLPTFMNSTGFHILKPFVRMGRKGSVVDNANCGGLFCVIDERSGELITDGYDLRGNKYSEHPDSKHKLKGWIIPKWKDLLKTAEEIHSTVPNYPYIGWDFALTEKGWVVIGGNWGQFDSESADKEGIKPKFDAMFD